VRRLAHLAWVAALSACASGCIGSPSPLSPAFHGSVGLPHQGSLTGAAALPDRGVGFQRLRKDGVKWGNPRLVNAITHAAGAVAERVPGTPPLVVADLSDRFGGKVPRHRSHRTGRDVDLLFYAMTPDGRPERATGFVRFGPDGLGKAGRRHWQRFDVARQWELTKALIEAPDAHIQWIFCARWLEAMIIEWALAKGEDPELVWHAEVVLKQPGDSAPHDDHFHVRLACTPDESVAGCQGGPRWPWLPRLPVLARTDERWADERWADVPPLEPSPLAPRVP
jgi:penicillin-insensitive murein endopeptidase